MKTMKSISILTLSLLFIQNGIQAQKLRNKIVKSIAQMEESYTSIPEERRIMLDQLASIIFNKKKDGESVAVIFIDSENKEKSQFAAIWLRTGLLHYQLQNYHVYSAGTKISEKPFPTLSHLEKYGFRVNTTENTKKYLYKVKFGTQSWTVDYNSLETLDLKVNNTVEIFVEQGITSEEGSKQIEISFYDTDRIGLEMLYVSARIQFLDKVQL